EIMPEVIYTCCDLKRKVVEKDEKDTGERMLLNFGHTFGHAIEKLGNYTKYTHGEGVAIGMCLAAKYGEGMGITPNGTADKIVDICKAYALPTDDGVDVSQIAELSKIDKKANDGQVNLVLLETLGNAKCVPTAFGKFSDNLKNIF
ncbi:MAG: 3-dehydroquinate synthase, partial [Oscillospiraceae bacterium]